MQRPGDEGPAPAVRRQRGDRDDVVEDYLDALISLVMLEAALRLALELD